MKAKFSIFLFAALSSWGLLNLPAAEQPRRDPIIPPTLNQRDGVISKAPLAGEKFILEDGGIKFALFLPPHWTAPTNGEVVLAVHFHSNPRYAFDEHSRRGLNGPFLAVELGAVSSAFRKPFEDHERFGRLISLTTKKLQEHGAPGNSRISAIEISSFSAGYSAVREILKVPEYFKLIRRLVLCDSIYAGFESETVHQPSHDNIEVWVPFVKAAARGEKTFVLTHSQVPTGTYATSGECAAALIASVGASVQKVAPSSTPASSDPDFPLLYRSDLGNFHVWGYGGTNGQAHLTHLRHMADTWMALDTAERNLPAKDEK